MPDPEHGPPSTPLEGIIQGSLNVDGTPVSPRETSAEATPSTQLQPESESAEDEQALEWHEVIELQAFSERKAWIEEKIKVDKGSLCCVQRLPVCSSSRAFHLSKSSRGWMLCGRLLRRYRDFLAVPSWRNGWRNTTE